MFYIKMNLQLCPSHNITESIIAVPWQWLHVVTHSCHNISDIFNTVHIDAKAVAEDQGQGYNNYYKQYITGHVKLGLETPSIIDLYAIRMLYWTHPHPHRLP